MRDAFWSTMGWIVNDGVAWSEVAGKWKRLFRKAKKEKGSSAR